MQVFHEWWLRPMEQGFALSGNRDVICAFWCGVLCFLQVTAGF